MAFIAIVKTVPLASFGIGGVPHTVSSSFGLLPIDKAVPLPHFTIGGFPGPYQPGGGGGPGIVGSPIDSG